MSASENNIGSLSRLLFSIRQQGGTNLFEARQPTTVRKKKQKSDVYVLTFDRCVVPSALPLVLSFEWSETEETVSETNEISEEPHKDEQNQEHEGQSGEEDEWSFSSFEEDKVYERPRLRWTQGFKLCEESDWYSEGTFLGSRIAVDRRLEDGSWVGLGYYNACVSPVTEIGAVGSELQVYLQCESLVELVMDTERDYSDEESYYYQTLGDRIEALWPKIGTPVLLTRFT